MLTVEELEAIIAKVKFLVDEYDLFFEDSLLLNLFNLVAPTVYWQKNRFQQASMGQFFLPQKIVDLNIFPESTGWSEKFSTLQRELWADHDLESQKQAHKKFQKSLLVTLSSAESKEEFNQYLSKVFNDFISDKYEIQRKFNSPFYPNNLNGVAFIFKHIPFDILNQENRLLFVNIGQQILFHFNDGFDIVGINNIFNVITSSEDYHQLIEVLLANLEEKVLHSTSDHYRNKISHSIYPISSANLRDHMTPEQVNRLRSIFQKSMSMYNKGEVTDFISCFDSDNERDINMFLQILKNDFQCKNTDRLSFSTHALVEMKDFLDRILINHPSVKKQLLQHFKKHSKSRGNIDGKSDWSLYNQDISHARLSASNARWLHFENIAYRADTVFSKILSNYHQKKPDEQEKISMCLLGYFDDALSDDKLLKTWINAIRIKLCQLFRDETNSGACFKLFKKPAAHRIIAALTLFNDPADTFKVAACHARLYEAKILEDYVSDVNNELLLTNHWMRLVELAESHALSRVHLQAFYEQVLWNALYNKKSFKSALEVFSYAVDSNSPAGLALARVKDALKESNIFIPNQELAKTLLAKELIISSEKYENTVLNQTAKQFPTKIMDLFLTQYEASRTEGVTAFFGVAGSKIISDLRDVCKRNPESIDLTLILSLNGIQNFNRDNQEETGTYQLLRKIDCYIINMLDEPRGLNAYFSLAASDFPMPEKNWP